jgi:hypothetical protein
MVIPTALSTSFTSKNRGSSPGSGKIIGGKWNEKNHTKKEHQKAQSQLKQDKMKGGVSNER